MTYFFSQDSDCHWYMIPSEKRQRWNDLNQEETEENNDAINDEFGEYRTGGDITGIEFIPTNKMES